MGTRNLTAVVVDGEYKIAQYGQWDGYPSGQGVTILKHLRELDHEKLKENARKCRWINPAKVDEITEQLKKDANDNSQDGWMNMNTSNLFETQYPHLHRNCGGEILGYVYEANNGLSVGNNLEFAYDSLFCEWAYVVDFDLNTFEVYEGFNNTPLHPDERFYIVEGWDRAANKHNSDAPYYPVRQVAEFSLDDLPTVEEFINLLEPKEDQEN